MKQQEREGRRRKKRLRRYALFSVPFLIYGLMAAVVRPDVTVEYQQVGLEHQATTLHWPETGQASVGDATSHTVLDSKDGIHQVPSASTIKLLTALVVLEQKPIGPAEQGDMIQFTSADIDRYNEILAMNGSALMVPDGTSISYRQALDAMLVDSANNIADKLAIWGFGSSDAYLKAAQVYIAKHGLSSTHVTDASGLSANTVTSAEDMVKIADLAAHSSTVSAITKQASIAFYDGTQITNTNTLLSDPSILGYKTGNTEQAGYCLVAGKLLTIGDVQRVVLASVMGQPSRKAAADAVTTLFNDMLGQYEQAVIASKAEPLAQLRMPWGEKVPIHAAQEIRVTRWRGQGIAAKVVISKTDHLRAGDKVGELTILDGTHDLIVDESLPQPSLWWRLTHAVDIFFRKK